VSAGALSMLRFYLKIFGVSFEEVPLAMRDPGEIPWRAYYISKWLPKGPGVRYRKGATWYEILNEVFHAVVDLPSTKPLPADGPDGTEQQVYNLLRKFAWDFLNPEEQADAVRYIEDRGGTP
jgi:hypothetical protein